MSKALCDEIDRFRKEGANLRRRVMNAWDGEQTLSAVQRGEVRARLLELADLVEDLLVRARDLPEDVNLSQYEPPWKKSAMIGATCLKGDVYQVASTLAVSDVETYLASLPLRQVITLLLNAEPAPQVVAAPTGSADFDQ